MTRWRNRSYLSGAALAAVLLALLAHGVFAPVRAQDAAQPSPSTPSPATSATPQPPQPPPDNRPGFIHQLGVWWDQAKGAVDDKAKGKADDPNKKPDEAAKSSDAAKAAADAVSDATHAAATASGNAVNSAVEATKGAAATATDSVKGAATTAGDAMKGAFEATRNAATSIVKLPSTRVVDIRETCAKAANGGSDCTEAAAAGCRSKGFAGGKALEVRTAQACDIKPLQSGNLGNPLACGQETTVIRAVCQ